MTQGYVIESIRQLIVMAGLLAGPVLLGGLVVGVVMGIIQSATQIQENALTFVPKLLAIGACVGWGGPWALEKIVTYTVAMLQEIVALAPRGLG